jgi:hypothetical protein
MKKLNRREMLRGAAGLSLAALGTHTAAAMLTESSPVILAQAGKRNAAPKPAVSGTYQLLVVFHGMMTLEFKKSGPANQKVLVRAPEVCAHSFGAGNWTVESSLEAATPANPYALMNVNDGTYAGPVLNSSSDVVIDGTGLSASGSPHCVLALPWPDNVLALRPLLRDPSGVVSPDFFVDGKTKKANNLQNVTSLQLLHVLVYSNLAYATGGNPPTLNNAQANFGTDGVAHLHIFCEPTFEPLDPMGHLNDALAAMNLLFSPNLDLKFNSNSNVASPAALTGVPSPMYHGEQFSLAEHRAQCNPLPTKGGAPRNCMQLLVVE